MTFDDYVSGCGCDDCVEFKGKRKGDDMAKRGFFVNFGMPKSVRAEPVSLAKPEKPKRKVIEVGKRAPSGLGLLSQTAIDYFANPSKYLDMETLREEGGYSGGSYTVQGMTFEQVTGLTKLGSGHYSDVYAIDDNRVIKVVKRGDSGFARFVSVIRPLNNPHFPKILFAGVWGGKQVYIMERLTPEAATLGYDAASQFREVMRAGPNPWVKFATPAMDEAARVMKENSLDSDFHGDNLMWRGDVPVINDPTSEGDY